MSEDPTAAVVWMVRGAWVTMSVRAGCRPEVFDLLDEPRSPASLAVATGSDAGALARLLRALASLGLLEAHGDGTFANTPLGATLREDHPSGVRNLALMQSWLPNVATWNHLDDAVHSGTGVYERVNGAPPWEHLSAHPDVELQFNRSMARRADGQIEALVAGTDLADAETVVDVGGGRGAMLAGVLRAWPHLSGVVADRPEVAADADAAFADAGLTARAHGVASDFFASVPSGADVYLLSNVLHDWADEDCVRILRTVHAAMDGGARLVIVEKLLDVPGRSSYESRDLAFVDLHMLVMFGARERTKAEYDTLLVAAGFTQGVMPETGTSWNVIVAGPDRAGGSGARPE